MDDPDQPSSGSPVKLKVEEFKASQGWLTAFTRERVSVIYGFRERLPVLMKRLLKHSLLSSGRGLRKVTSNIT